MAIITLPSTLRAWHGRPELQAEALAEMVAHREAERLVQGYGYWRDGKGCAVGCLIKSGNHLEYETRFGIPVALARLEDLIFERLSVDVANTWPELFLGAAAPGADLTRVSWRLLHWLLTDEKINPGITHPLVSESVRRCAEIIALAAETGTIDEDAAWWSAKDAAESAAESAASAESAARWSAAWWSAAWSAAWSAERAARSAASAARSAAWLSAAWSAASAASVAESGACAAESAAYARMADRLIELMRAAPVPAETPAEEA